MPHDREKRENGQHARILGNQIDQFAIARIETRLYRPCKYPKRPQLKDRLEDQKC